MGIKVRDIKFKQNIEKLRDKLDSLLSEHEEIGMSGAGADMEAEAIKEWLKENHKIVKLIELIPKAKRAEGELAYITKGQYRKHWGREPKPVILTADGKRVRWEYALGEIAQELRLEDKYGSGASEALKDLIELAVEYKHKLRTLYGKSANSDNEYKQNKKAIENISVNIGRREQVADMQDSRSEQAKAIDSSFQAKEILTFPKVTQWLDNPNRYDIRGVDTRRRLTKAQINKLRARSNKAVADYLGNKSGRVTHTGIKGRR